MAKPTALLFDWDGTIVDTLPLINFCHNEIAKKYGTPQKTLDESHKLTIYDSLTVTGKLAGAENAQEALAMFKDLYYARHLDFLSDKAGGYKGLIPGAAAFMEEVHKLGIPKGVVTNKGRGGFDKESAFIGWGDWFAASVCPGEASVNKPDKAVALLCLEKMGLKPGKDIWFIGDTEGDVLCGKNAGLTTIIVGEYKAETQPDHIFKTYADLSAFMHA